MLWKNILSAVGGKFRPPLPGRAAHPEPADRYRGGRIGAMTPERLGDIIDAADICDIEELMRAAPEIEAENWDIQHAMDVRRNALCGCSWDILPAGDGGAVAAMLADRFRRELADAGGTGEGEPFARTVRALTGAVIAPFAVAEIIWGAGGRLAGFVPLDGRHFTARQGTGLRLVTSDHPEGVALAEHKFLVHRLGNTVDPLADGKIRTLAWLHVFQNYPIKDLLSFIERYGMPFVIGKLGESAWERDRELIRRLIRNFGSAGGGVFSKGVEIELLQASNNTGEVYFRLLEYTGNAIVKVLLGQLASSAESGGLSGGDAQSRVRQDILEADARALEDTINTQLIRPWTLWHAGSLRFAPRLVIRTKPAEDARAYAEMVETLYRAGLAADPEEVGARCGLKLHRRDQK